MKDIASIARELPSLRNYSADYLEVRLEEGESSHITYRGRELESIDRSSSSGGNVRAAVKGGWGFVSFNSFEQLPDRISQAISQARYVSGDKTQLAEVRQVVDTAPAPLLHNPVGMPLAEKKALLDEYNDVIWRTSGIQTSSIGYGDAHRKVVFLNSIGSHIIQERADVTLRLNAIAAKDGDVQQVGLSLGSLGNFDKIRGLHKQVEDMSQKAVQMLSAPHVKGGEYTVVLDPILAGVFVHEAFGHLS